MINIDELRIKLLKLGTELGEFDREVRGWHQWFIRQTELFEESKLSMRVYKAVLERYETFLNKKRGKVPPSQIPSRLSKEDPSISEKAVDSSSSLICPSCGEESTSISKFCVYCGQALAKKSTPIIPTTESQPDSVSRAEKGEELESDLTFTGKAKEEESLEPSTTKLIDTSTFSTVFKQKTEEEKSFEPPAKPVSETPHEKEFIKESVPITEKVEELESGLPFTKKAEEEDSEPPTKKLIDISAFSKVFTQKTEEEKSSEPPTKPVSETPQKREIIKKPDLVEGVSKIDVKKVPERKAIRKRQLDWSDIVSFGWLTIFGSIIFVIVLIFITLVSPGPNISRGLLVFTFLIFLAGIIFDILRWKNFDFSALGAIIAYIGIVMVFCVPLADVIDFKLKEGDEFLGLLWNSIAILFIIGGAGARWSDYDTKIVNMATMVIGYWQNYQKRAAIKKFFHLILVFLGGLLRSIVGGIKHFPRRLGTFLGRIYQVLKVYIQANIGLITDAVKRISRTIWNSLHWFGLLAIFGYILNSSFHPSEFYRNTELLIIILFFFILGILTSRSERVMKAVSNTRTVILKGAISAYSMLSGAKIKKEESIFCSRCLRGVHQIEFAELQHVEDTDNPLCPYCGYENWITVN